MAYLFSERIFGVPWLVLAAGAAVLAVVYVVVPAGAAASGLHWFVLRWFHSIAWTFLALAAFVRARVSDAPLEWAAPLGATGGLVYVAFMITSVAAQSGGGGG
jgi:hypothetical protein